MRIIPTLKKIGQAAGALALVGDAWPDQSWRLKSQ